MSLFGPRDIAALHRKREVRQEATKALIRIGRLIGDERAKELSDALSQSDFPDVRQEGWKERIRIRDCPARPIGADGSRG